MEHLVSGLDKAGQACDFLEGDFAQGFKVVAAVAGVVPIPMVGKICKLAHYVCNQIQQARHNKVALQMAAGLVAEVADQLDRVCKLPREPSNPQAAKGTKKLIEAIHATKHVLVQGSALVQKYGFENCIKQFFSADSFKQQIYDWNQRLGHVRSNFMTELQLLEAEQNRKAIAEAKREADEMKMRIERLEKKQKADLESWSTSKWVCPETGTAADGSPLFEQADIRQKLKDEIDDRLESECEGESVVSLGRAGLWTAVASRLDAHPKEARSAGFIYTLLHQAVFWESSYAVTLVLQNGADVNAVTRARDPTLDLPAGSTALHLATAIGNPDLCRLLICWGCSRRLKNAAGQAAQDMKSTPDCLKVLQDGDLRQQVATAGQYAKEQNFPQLISMLEEYDLPLNVQTGNDFCIIHHVVRGGQYHVYKLLLAQGASPLLRTAKGKLLPSQVYGMYFGKNDEVAAKLKWYENREQQRLKAQES
jgi:hypothetical protein